MIMNDSSCRRKTMDDLLKEPGLVSLAQFQDALGLSKDDSETARKYEEYKVEHAKKIAKPFFDEHKNETWYLTTSFDHELVFLRSLPQGPFFLLCLSMDTFFFFRSCSKLQFLCRSPYHSIASSSHASRFRERYHPTCLEQRRQEQITRVEEATKCVQKAVLVFLVFFFGCI